MRQRDALAFLHRLYTASHSAVSKPQAGKAGLHRRFDHAATHPLDHRPTGLPGARWPSTRTGVQPRRLHWPALSSARAVRCRLIARHHPPTTHPHQLTTRRNRFTTSAARSTTNRRRCITCRNGRATSVGISCAGSTGTIISTAIAGKQKAPPMRGFFILISR
jgi:hypothetical protein